MVKTFVMFSQGDFANSVNKNLMPKPKIRQKDKVRSVKNPQNSILKILKNNQNNFWGFNPQ